MEQCDFYIRKIYFVNSHSFKKNENSCIVDFQKRKILSNENSIHFDYDIKESRDLLTSYINNFFAKLNKLNSSTEWWAFNFTSKNPLSAKLYYDILDYLIVLKHINTNSYESVYIIGANPFLRAAILKEINCSDLHFSSLNYNLYLLFKSSESILRSIGLLIQTFLNFFWISILKSNKEQYYIFSYVDTSKRQNRDPFFGNLIEYLNRLTDIPISYLFYVDRPYRKKLANLKEEVNAYQYLFSFLKVKDYLKAFFNLISILNKKWEVPRLSTSFGNIDLTPILKMSIIDEIGKNYIDNLLVYYSILNFNKNNAIKKFIYPFENKSIEKMLLLGLTNLTNSIGYQHTSITTRHYSYIFTKEEILVTPLPNSIITLGKITADWLKEKGNIPSDKIKVGFSLRHNLSRQFSKQRFNYKNAKLLFAFSSGYFEIIKTIDFLEKVLLENPNLDCCFRTHVSYPLSKLPGNYQEWISENVKISSAQLIDDLEWADITVYISSTVSLESLYVGVPIIHLDFDILDSDPVLDKQLSFKWNCYSPESFILAIKEISEIYNNAKIEKVKIAQKYVSEYLRKSDSEYDYELFI